MEGKKVGERLVVVGESTEGSNCSFCHIFALHWREVVEEKKNRCWQIRAEPWVSALYEVYVDKTSVPQGVEVRCPTVRIGHFMQCEQIVVGMRHHQRKFTTLCCCTPF